jgi:hypothetical protein
MIQVRPLADDKPEERQVQLWTAVTHQNGVSTIDDVYWKIYHPDGTFKIQVHGARVPTSQIASLGTSAASDVGKMFEAAVHTGQITAPAVDDINKGLIAKALQNEVAIYYAKFSISKEQPCGQYVVEEHAVSGGAESVIKNYIDVLCFYQMELDFSSVDWATIQPGRVDIVSGDLLFTPPSDAYPTVKNTGNIGMGLGLHFSAMVQQGVSGGKTITDFDACFGRSPSTLQCIDPIPASVPTNFDSARDRVLCSNEIGKLDLSIHPPITLPAGTYAGTVDVIARAVRGICPTDQEALIP